MAKPSEHPPTGSVILAFLTGSRKGNSVVIDKQGVLRIGRDPECEVHLPEPNVSRVHGALLWDGAKLSVEDRKSTNGIYLNGERVTNAAVKDNDVLAVGPCVFRVAISQAVADGDERSTVVMPQGAGEELPEHAAEVSASEQFQGLFGCMVAIQRILSEEPEKMVEACLDTVFLALPVTRLCLLKVNAAGELEPWLTRTKSGITREFVMSRTFARKVREAGKAVLIHDALHLDAAEWGTTMQQQEVRSILGVPVFHKGTAIAILLCDNLEKPNILRDEHVRTLEFFAKALETVYQREQISTLVASQAATERQFLAAKRVQKQIFTKRPAREMGGLQWAFHFQPALQVGGDFYDFSMTGDEVTWIVADVTGKGISAALVVSMLKGFCKTIFPRNPRPRDMLVELNKLILDELPPEMFLTAVVCHTTPAGTITFANAGHLPMLLLCADPAATPVVARLKPQGVPLGFLAPSEFDGKIEEQQARLARGDMLLLCTDGVTEAVNANNEFFGEKRLIEQLTAMRGQSVEEALTRLRRTLDEFQGATAQHDDITIVLGQY